MPARGDCKGDDTTILAVGAHLRVRPGSAGVPPALGRRHSDFDPDPDFDFDFDPDGVPAAMGKHAGLPLHSKSPPVL